MPKKTKFILMLFVLALSLGATSCRKLQTTQPPPTSAVPTPVNVLEAIPLEYGDLVSVTVWPENIYWAQLWFQKPDKTITIVWVNVSQKRVVVGTTIPRK